MPDMRITTAIVTKSIGWSGDTPLHRVVALKRVILQKPGSGGHTLQATNASP
jgi:hypothetical protein